MQELAKSVFHVHLACLTQLFLTLETKKKNKQSAFGVKAFGTAAGRSLFWSNKNVRKWMNLLTAGLPWCVKSWRLSCWLASCGWEGDTDGSSSERQWFGTVASQSNQLCRILKAWWGHVCFHGLVGLVLALDDFFLGNLSRYHCYLGQLRQERVADSALPRHLSGDLSIHWRKSQWKLRKLGRHPLWSQWFGFGIFDIKIYILIHFISFSVLSR